MKKDPDVEPLQRRFAQRLNLALTEAGYSAVRARRAQELANQLGLDNSVTAAWLGGFRLPNWSEFVALCRVTRRPIEFFLQDHVDQFPPGTSIVKSIGPGENIAIRLPPDEVSQPVVGTGLCYYVAPDAMGFGVEAGDYVIARVPDEDIPMVLNALYLFSEPDGYAIRRCVEMTGGRAVFQSQFEGELSVVRPMATPPGQERDFGEILCLWRVGKNLQALHG